MGNKHRDMNTDPALSLKAADDDAGNLQSVFLKRLYLLHISIFSFFSFQHKFNNHLKKKNTDYDHLNHDFTVWELLFHFDVECSFFHISVFNSQTANPISFFLFARCLVEWLSKNRQPNLRHFQYFSRYSTFQMKCQEFSFVSCSSQHLVKKELEYHKYLSRFSH